MPRSVEVRKIATQLDAIISLRDNFSKTLESIDRKTQDFQRTAQRMGRDVWKTGKTLENTGTSLTKGLTVPIVGIGVAAGKMSKDFNESLASIGTMIPGQTERLQEFKGEIQDVAITTAKSTKEIAEGTYGVISAYGDAEDTMQKVELNAKAATAGLATTNDALDLSSAIMKGYGDTTAESNEKVLDLAFTTLKLGQTTFPDLAASMGKVVPTSNELGISQEELFAIFATGTGVTGNASEVSTQYQGVLKSLMSPTKDMSKLIDDMGYKDGKAMIAKEGLGGAINTIVDSAKKSGKPLSSYVGSIQGQVLALALAGEQSDVYDEKLQELMESTGALDTAFLEQTEGINKTGFSFEQSMIKMQVAGQKLGDALAPTIERLADGFSKFADKLSNLTPEQLDSIIGFAKMAIVIGPIISVVGKLTTRVSDVIFFFSDFAKKAVKMGGVLNALKSPGMLVAGTFIALIATGILLYKNWDKIKTKAEEIFPGIGEKISTAFEAVKTVISTGLEFIRELWETHGTAMLETISLVWELISVIFSTAMEFIGNVISIGVEIIQGLWSMFGETIMSVASSAWSMISGIIGGAMSVIQGVINVVLGIIQGDWSRVWEGIQQIFEGVMTAVSAAWNGAKEILSTVIEGVVEALTDKFHSAVEAAQKAWEGLRTFLKNPIKGTVNLAKKGAGWVADKIGNNYKGTDNWRGGPTWVHEKGAEIIDLPSGSRVYPHDKSLAMAREEGRSQSSGRGISIAKLADQIIVREDADIDKIADAMVRKIQKAELNMA